MRLRWIDAAIVDLDQRLDDLAAINPQAAGRVAVRVDATIHRLMDYPHLGRAGDEAGTRELAVKSTPLIVVYQTEADEIVIIRVCHAAQKWPR